MWPKNLGELPRQMCVNVLYNRQEKSKLRLQGLLLLKCLLCALQVPMSETAGQQRWRYLARGHIKWIMHWDMKTWRDDQHRDRSDLETTARNQGHVNPTRTSSDSTGFWTFKAIVLRCLFLVFIIIMQTTLSVKHGYFLLYWVYFMHKTRKHCLNAINKYNF